MSEGDFVQWFAEELLAERELIRKTILEILPQGHSGGFNADLLDTFHAEEIIEKASTRGYLLTRKLLGTMSRGGGGMSKHGNEFHTPNFHPTDSDLLPATDGLFLGSDSKRWDGSKLLNLPAGGGGKAVLGLGYVWLNCESSPYEHQYSPLAPGNSIASNNSSAFQTPMIAGTLTKLKVRVTNVNSFAIDVPVYIMKNGALTNATVTIPAGVTNTTYTWSGNVSVAENDRLNMYYCLQGAEGWENMSLTLCIEFKPS